MDYNKKEKLIYTLIVCFVMEFLMAYYNYFFHTDAFLDEAFILACIEFVPAFIIGVLCEYFLISNPAKKIAKYLHKKHFNHKNIIHINEMMIVIGMMLVISIFGAIYHQEGIKHTLLYTIINDFFKNAIFGIPLFMLVVSPAARLFINKYI
ncbi:MAG: hypothetical protein EOM50_09945, partial [Erysipelotrichia bacterium]|nr:hypothetical protein [Erysipelotrichia bacterium]NCC54935.1 hypothetical protein [Erysipelotrichia bacterium]